MTQPGEALREAVRGIRAVIGEDCWCAYVEADRTKHDPHCLAVRAALAAPVAGEALREAAAEYMQAVTDYLDAANQYTESRLHAVGVTGLRLAAALIDVDAAPVAGGLDSQFEDMVEALAEHNIYSRLDLERALAAGQPLAEEEE